MNLFVATIVFILGASLGSFLSVVIYRIHSKKKGIILSRSICPHCKKELKWRHLIPVFSWMLLRGKCAYCSKKISSHYTMLEITMGLAFLAVFLNWNFLQVAPSLANPEFLNYSIDWHVFEKFVFYAIETFLLIGIFFYDLLYRQIPDRFSLPAIGVAIAGGLVFGEPSSIDMLIGGGGIFAFFLLQYLLSKGKWIGGGDLRLGALMGILLGWEKGILALVLSYLIGSVFSLALLVQKKATGKTKIAFGPFLVLGIAITIFYGDIILDYYLSILNP